MSSLTHPVEKSTSTSVHGVLSTSNTMFWGIELKPGKTEAYVPPPMESKLHLSTVRVSLRSASGRHSVAAFPRAAAAAQGSGRQSRRDIRDICGPPTASETARARPQPPPGR